MTTKKVACRQDRKEQRWEGVTPRSIYTAGKLEQKMRTARTRDRQELKKLHCNVFKERRPAVPSIPCVAHRTRK